MTQEQFGTATPVFDNLTYNSRQQLTFIGATTLNDGVTWNRGKIGNRYGLQCNAFDSGCAAADNNGNLIWQDIFIPSDDQVSSYTSWLQRYDYDTLNRLKSGGESDPNFSWQHGYQYDQYGNRTINTASSWGEVPWVQFSADPNTNRLGVPSGQSGTMTYDNAGNLIVDTYTGEGQRNYDAENRMTYAWANGLLAVVIATAARCARPVRHVESSSFRPVASQV